MKTSSAKSKGRKAVQEVKTLLHYYAPVLDGGDIMVPAGSQPGADLHLSPAAKAIYPFAIEIKCQESLNIWSALKQAETHGPDIPIVFFKRNRSELYCSLKAEDLLKLLNKASREYLKHSESPVQKDSGSDSKDQSTQP